jgi:hypothetical protein
MCVACQCSVWFAHGAIVLDERNTRIFTIYDRKATKVLPASGTCRQDGNSRPQSLCRRSHRPCFGTGKGVWSISSSQRMVRSNFRLLAQRTHKMTVVPDRTALYLMCCVCALMGSHRVNVSVKGYTVDTKVYLFRLTTMSPLPGNCESLSTRTK